MWLFSWRNSLLASTNHNTDLFNYTTSEIVSEYETDISTYADEPGRTCAKPCNLFCAPGDRCEEQAESKPLCTQSSAGSRYWNIDYIVYNIVPIHCEMSDSSVYFMVVTVCRIIACALCYNYSQLLP